MILKAFCLLDTKTGMHDAPFFMAHVGQATRAVADTASDTRNLIGRHPSDFCLMGIGEFDDQTGTLHPSLPVNHGSVVSFLERDQAQAPPLFAPNQAGFGEKL